MGTPNEDYRENPARAVYIAGAIDQPLLDRLTPRINELRFIDAGKPITAYIDSPGGSIALAETIRDLIKSPTQDGKRSRLITVVTGGAASAAADLLALGDYAIAYPHAEVLYHGSRQSLTSALTSEMASVLARNLEQTNEFFAVRLARRAFARFVLRITQFTDEFQRYTNETPPAFSVIVGALRRELSTSNGKLIREAMRKQRIIGELSAFVGRRMMRLKNHGVGLSPAKFESEIFKAIVTRKTTIHKKDPWLLSNHGMREVTDDFNLLHDFHFGSQKKDLTSLEKTYGELFLSKTEKEEFSKLIVPPDEKEKWLCAHAEPKLQPVWYFTVSLCRLLQREDYNLRPEEAYWLGLLDEVPGSGLPNLRAAVESLPGPTQPSNAAPP